MGVKFAREYDEIITDLTQAMMDTEGCYQYLEMADEDWTELTLEEQQDCIKTMADDVFYGLGEEPDIDMGVCVVSYDSDNHILKLATPDKVTRVIRLI